MYCCSGIAWLNFGPFETGGNANNHSHSIFGYIMFCLPLPYHFSWIPLRVIVLGSTNHIKENAETVPLTDDEMFIVEGILERFPVAGDRFPKYMMEHMDL